MLLAIYNTRTKNLLSMFQQIEQTSLPINLLAEFKNVMDKVQRTLAFTYKLKTIKA